jgi:16S rRNA processing protein RimM
LKVGTGAGPDGGSAPPERIVVGRLGGPHGVRGEMRLFPETDFPERLRAGRRVLVCPRAGPPFPTEIRSARPGPGGVWLLAVHGVDSPEAARRFAGGTLCVSAADLPPLPEGHYYHHQLVGLTVLRPDGRPLGRLAEILHTGANDVFGVRTAEGGTVLVPATRDAVAAIDLEAGVVRLRDLPGLLEEQTPGRRRTPARRGPGGGACASTS